MSRPGDVFHVLLDELLVLEHDLLTGERGGGRPLGESCFGCSHSLVHLVCNQALVTKTQYSFGHSQGVARRAWAHPIFGTTKTSEISTNAKAPCQLKKPFKGLKRRRGSCWEELQKIVFPDEESLICPQGKSIIFYKKETKQH